MPEKLLFLSETGSFDAVPGRARKFRVRSNISTKDWTKPLTSKSMQAFCPSTGVVRLLPGWPPTHRTGDAPHRPTPGSRRPVIRSSLAPAGECYRHSFGARLVTAELSDRDTR